MSAAGGGSPRSLLEPAHRFSRRRAEQLSSPREDGAAGDARAGAAREADSEVRFPGPRPP